MNLFNRMFIAVLAMAWIAALAGVLYLIWENQAITITSENLMLDFDIITSSRAEQILATLIVAALGVPALGLLLAEFLPRGRVREVRDARDYDRLQQRVDTLQQRLDSERHADRVERTEVTRPERHDAVEPQRRRRWGFLARSH